MRVVVVMRVIVLRPSAASYSLLLTRLLLFLNGLRRRVSSDPLRGQPNEHGNCDVRLHNADDYQSNAVLRRPLQVPVAAGKKQPIITHNTTY